MKWIKNKFNNLKKNHNRLSSSYENKYKLATCFLIGSCISGLFVKPILACNFGYKEVAKNYGIGDLISNIGLFILTIFLSLIFIKVKQRLIISWLKPEQKEIEKYAREYKKNEEDIWKIATYIIVIFLFFVMFVCSPLLIQFTCYMNKNYLFISRVITGLIGLLTLATSIPDKTKK